MTDSQMEVKKEAGATPGLLHVLVFTVSMFASAVLLFLVEPMIAKMMLPMLGGTPAVWNTCLVFFQAVLFVGYLYAHGSMKWLGHRTQIVVHLVLVASPLLLVGLLPLHLPAGWTPPAETSPVAWILGLLAVAVGAPFFVLSSGAPVLQGWFARSGHRQAGDPYFLYAASNAGSLAGLLAYPLVFEPLLPLSAQSRLWSYGYGLFAAMIAVCAVLVWRGSEKGVLPAMEPQEVLTAGGGWGERLRWVALAFVPSSLMLGVTTALTTDVPAIPLLWVLPLALYLVSFVLVFAKRPLFSHEWLIRRVGLLILVSLVPVVSKTRFPLVLFLVLYLALLWTIAMVCHGELARNRPRISRLTEFYLFISAGGVLGGIFNSLIAPVVFHSVLEFPLVLILAILLIPAIDQKPLTGRSAVWARRKDWLLPLALGLCMAVVIVGLMRLGFRPGRTMTILIFGYSLLWCFSFKTRPVRLVLGIVAIMFASTLYLGPFGRVLSVQRSFFGVLRVTTDAQGRFHSIVHGGTIHGMQRLDPARSREPMTYYTRSGPAAQVIAASQKEMPKAEWAIVGLGAGTMACYLQPGQTLTYYEIDPLVAKIAEDQRYFTYLSQCAPEARVVLGDARIQLRDAREAQYGLIVLDAFSGDTIPMHLLTREALALYLRKLAPGGMLAFHISNLYLDIAPTLGDLASDAHLACMIERDTDVSEAQMDDGKFPSEWMVMARSQTDLDTLTGLTGSSKRWVAVAGRPGTKVWTDDYSNLISVIKWK